MKLRNYQQAAVEAVFESWKSNRSVLVSMATGLGKTVVLSAIIQRLLRESPGRRAMVLAHRSELIEQGQATIHRLTGADVQMEMADCRVVPMFGREPGVVDSTLQTQTAGEDGHERMRRFDPAGFGCVIVDEGHHAVSQSCRDCLGWYRQNPDLRVLGLTATPDRGDAQRRSRCGTRGGASPASATANSARDANGRCAARTTGSSCPGTAEAARGRSSSARGRATRRPR